MKISTKGRYALRLMLELAENYGKGYITLKDISHHQDLSGKYMEQIAAQLTRADYVKSVRGAQGGYMLSNPPESYTVGMILRLMEGSLAPVQCVDGLPCEREKNCSTIKVWKLISEAVDKVVDNITLADIISDNEERGAAEKMSSVKEEILKLKKEKNALVLAHYYQSLEVQEIADHVCDSFEMAKRARAAEEQLIIICGVHFMAESAKILSPQKKVLIPRPDAGCPMADMVTAEGVIEMRKKYPEAAVVCYVNSSAAVKAVSDICCTSSSALRIVRSLKEKQIIFVPDCNLGRFSAEQVPEKEFIFWDGYCPVHNQVTRQNVLDAKAKLPGAKFLVHPECRAEVVNEADVIGSTAEIINYVEKSDEESFIIGTELEIARRLENKFPEKKFVTVMDDFECVNMKKTTLEDVLACLKEEKNEIVLSDEEIAGARESLERMVNC